ncbi:MAG: Ldh family oxidoreductase [Alphaproteobacteria bacterium]|nr:Ldh family oxidoreductase [Alphaproteobacteria bacterium]
MHLPIVHKPRLVFKKDQAMTQNNPSSPRYHVEDMLTFGSAILSASGLPKDRAKVVAEILLEGDLMGHTTHGFQLLGPYADAAANGSMNTDGQISILRDNPALMLWDGCWLPGPWLVQEAIKEAQKRAKIYGQASIVIRRSHHIASLASYLRAPAENGFYITIATSDPAVASVAPYGGRNPVYTPNPIAIGYPTQKDPVIIDVSMSITTNGMSKRNFDNGNLFSHEWMLDATGQPTRDPAVLFQQPSGSILPMGGMDHGHKGFGLGLHVEAYTSALSGYGRADQPSRWGASLHIQVIDVEAAGGLESFTRETQFLMDACLKSEPAKGQKGVRIPGSRGLALRREQLQKGIQFYDGIIEGLTEKATKYGILIPSAL